MKHLSVFENSTCLEMKYGRESSYGSTYKQSHAFTHSLKSVGMKFCKEIGLDLRKVYKISSVRKSYKEVSIEV